VTVKIKAYRCCALVAKAHFNSSSPPFPHFFLTYACEIFKNKKEISARFINNIKYYFAEKNILEKKIILSFP